MKAEGDIKIFGMVHVTTIIGMKDEKIQGENTRMERKQPISHPYLGKVIDKRK